MLNFSIHSPQVQMWQARLSRVPSWAWLAVLIGVVAPAVVIGLAVLLVVMIVRTALRLVEGIVGLLTFPVRKALQRPVDDGRRNVRVMVHSARVIDP